MGYGGKLRAAYMRPLQVNRKRDMVSGCGPGMPGPYGAAMGRWKMAQNRAVVLA